MRRERGEASKVASQRRTGQDGLELLSLITSVRVGWCRVQISKYVVEIAKNVIETKIVPSRRSLGPSLAWECWRCKQNLG